MFFNKKNNGTDNSKTAESKFKKIMPKILSVVAAVTLWFYVVDSQTVIEEKEFSNIPVIIENLDESLNLEIVSGDDYSVDVVISGPVKELEKIKKENIVATVDISKMKKIGPDTFPISISFDDTYSGVEIIDKSISHATVRLDKSISKEFLIKADFSYGKIDNHYKYEEPVIKSDKTVTVTGPQSEVDRISYVKASVYTDEVKRSFDSKCSLKPVDEDGNPIESRYITLSKQTATINVAVDHIKLVKVAASFKKNENCEYKVTPSTVYIRGEASLVDGVSEVMTKDIAVFNKTVDAELILPDGIYLCDKEGNPAENLQVFIEETKANIETIAMVNSENDEQ